MKILVTGGAGFIGSHVVDALITKGHRVIVLDDLSTGRKENLNRRARLIRGKVESPATEKLVLRMRPQAIFHFAAQKDVRRSVLDPVFDAEVNVLGLLRLVKGASKLRLRRFVFASSGGAIYGAADRLPTAEDSPTHPLSPYGVSKLAAELYLHCYRHNGGLPVVSLRLANVYGPRQTAQSESGVAAIFTAALLRGRRPTIFGDGEQTRDFVYVGDVVRACMRALSTPNLGTYNIGTGLETSVNELWRLLAVLVGNNQPAVYAPPQRGEVSRSALNVARAKKFLGWEPKVPLARGLAKTIAWHKSKV